LHAPELGANEKNKNREKGGIFHLATTEIKICETATMAGAKANLELFDSATEILGLRGKWDQDKEDLRQVFDMMFSE